MHRREIFFALTFCLVAADSPRSRADDWPGWRGPGSLGVSSERTMASEWSSETVSAARRGILWALDLPHWGNSSPCVVADRIYLTAQKEDDSLEVFAIDRARGALVWERTVGKGKTEADELQNMATPTPCAAPGKEERVWALFGTGDLVCLDREGRTLWKRDLQADHGKYKILHGMGSSPLLHEGKLFVVCIHGGPSYVLAIDAASGRDAWKTARDLPAEKEAVDSYSSPILHASNGGLELIVGGADHLTGYDPASGRRRWIAGGLKIPHEWGRTIASPAAGDGIVVGCSSPVEGLGRMLAFKTGGEGDLTAAGPLWTYKKDTPDCPSPLCYRGHVYAVRDNGVASCLQASNGKLLWLRRLDGSGFKASPVAAAGRVYFISTDGVATVCEGNAEGKTLAVNRLEGSVFATPALSEGKIYIRTKNRLYAIGEKS